MLYYDIKIMVYLLRDLHARDSYEQVSRFVNYSFNRSDKLSSIHKDKGLKGYSLSGLYPVENDYIYKQGNVYTATMRTYSKDIVNEVVKCLNNNHNDTIVVTSVVVNQCNEREIEFIDTLTPTIITLKSGERWNVNKHTLDDMKDSIAKNLNRKYKTFIDKDFCGDIGQAIKCVELKKSYPFIIKYKGIKLTGFKIRVLFNNDEESQKIANLALVLGIGEKSSLCLGFSYGR